MLAIYTYRKGAEKEKERPHVYLLHAQRMESVGQLAAGIAREINTRTGQGLSISHVKL